MSASLFRVGRSGYKGGCLTTSYVDPCGVSGVSLLSGAATGASGSSVVFSGGTGLSKCSLVPGPGGSVSSAVTACVSAGGGTVSFFVTSVSPSSAPASVVVVSCNSVGSVTGVSVVSAGAISSGGVAASPGSGGTEEPFSDFSDITTRSFFSRTICFYELLLTKPEPTHNNTKNTLHNTGCFLMWPCQPSPPPFGRGRRLAPGQGFPSAEFIPSGAE